MQPCIYFVEKNIHGAWVVYGLLGVRQYYFYTEKEVVRRYREEYWQKEGQFVCQPV